MRIRLSQQRGPLGLTVFELCSCIIIGTVGGVYIWKPYLDGLDEARKKQKENEKSAKIIIK